MRLANPSGSVTDWAGLFGIGRRQVNARQIYASSSRAARRRLFRAFDFLFFDCELDGRLLSAAGTVPTSSALLARMRVTRQRHCLRMTEI